MKILLLAPQPFFQSRGTPIAVRKVLETLSQQGHQLEILTFPEGQTPEIPNCTIRRIPRIPGIGKIRPGFSVKKVIYDGIMFGSFLNRVRHRHCDVVHAVEESAFFALAGKKLFGVPYVYDMDSSLPEQLVAQMPLLKPLRPIMDWLERLLIRESCGVVAVCRSLEEIASKYGPRTPIVRVEDVSLIEPARHTVTDDLLVDDVGPIFMYVGNLEPYQGVDLLLDSFVHVFHQHDSARLVVIGGTTDQVKRYHDRAVQFCVSERAHFLGPRPLQQLGDYLSRADILVSPRISGNNTPMKIFSYMDAGKPLLATRLPTHTQVLTDDIACLVDPYPLAMAEGMMRLLRSPAYREEIAFQGRRRAQKEYTDAVLNSKLVDFYEEVETSLKRPLSPEPHENLP